MNVNKRQLVVCVLTCSVVFSLQVKNSFAQKVELSSTNDLLEYSLYRLKESAEDVLSKNTWLRSEIKKVNLSIKKAQIDLENSNKVRKRIEKNLSELDKYKAIQSREYFTAQHGVDRIQSDQYTLEEKYEMLSKEIETKVQKNKELKESIQQIQKDILSLRVDIDEIDLELKMNNGKSKMASLVEEEKEKSGVIKTLENKLSKIQSKPDRSMAKYKELESQRRMIKQKIILHGREYKDLTGDEKKVLGYIEGFESDHQKKMASLNKELKKLREKKNKLSKTLKKARMKLGKKGISSDEFSNEEMQLVENLNVIKRENYTLKERLQSLESK